LINLQKRFPRPVGWRLRQLGALLAVFASLGVACKSGQTGGTTVPSTYQEDLSRYQWRDFKRLSPDELAKQVQATPAVTVPSGATAQPTGAANPELDAVRASLAENNKTLRYAQGYRVQVYSGNSRDEANRLITQLRLSLDQDKPELVYDPPNYKVKVGDYFHKYEAYRLYVQLLPGYPAAIIVQDRINLDLSRYKK
jgi:sugar phosphate isomerase/epimerase